MALSGRVLAAIARGTPEEMAETRRWCELGDRVRLLGDLTEGRVSAIPPKGKRTEDPGVRRQRRAKQAK